MRRVVGAIALLLLLLFLVSLIIFPGAGAQPAPAKEGGGESAPVQLLLRSAEIADWGGAPGAGGGGGQAAVLRLSLFSPGAKNVSAFCSPSPLQKNALILAFPSVPGTDRNLSSMVAAALSQSGISSRMAGADDALSSQNALIIAPTGAIPLPLLEGAEMLRQQNSRVIVLQSLAGKAIDSEGSIVPMNASLPEGFRLVPLPPSGAAEAASSAARMAVFLQRAPAARGAAGNFTLAVPINASAAYCRAIVETAEGRHRFSDSGMLAAGKGSLRGPARLAAGEEGIYEFSLSGGEEVGRQLRFFVAAYSPSGEEWRREIAGGRISEGWASRFALDFTRGGKYVVRVADQFGRQHAAAYVEVPALQAQLLSAEGNRYEFEVLLDGEPAEGTIEARLDNGTPKNYSLQAGRLVVWAAPAPGSHAFRFSLSGSQASCSFSAQQSGMGAFLDTYLRLGVPAAIFLAAVFLLLRAGRRAKYSITFPEAAPSPAMAEEVTRTELERAYSRADARLGGFCLPCYPHEIAAELGRDGKGGFDPQSVLGCLKKLARQGAFCEHEGAFMPSSKMGGFSPPQLAMLRTIHELMLERGLRFSRKMVITVRRNELELALFDGAKSVLAGMGRACRAVVFAGSGELEAFEESLRSPGREETRARLAIGNGKVVLVVASRQGLEGVLP